MTPHRFSYSWNFRSVLLTLFTAPSHPSYVLPSAPKDNLRSRALPALPSLTAWGCALLFSQLPSRPCHAPHLRRTAATSEDAWSSRRSTNLAILGLTALAMWSYSNHCIWVTSEAYSSPSIVLISGWGPNRHVLDDFREAYYWCGWS